MRAEFVVLTLAGKPVIAARAGAFAALRRAASQYPATTPKKRLFRIFAGTPLSAPWCIHEENPLASFGVDAANLLDGIEAWFGRPQATPIIVWPHGRQDRIHVRLVGSSGGVLGFAKVGFGRAVDGVANEIRALAAISSGNPLHFKVPAIVGSISTDQLACLATSAIPADARPVYPERVKFPRNAVREYAGPVRHLSACALASEPWRPNPEVLNGALRLAALDALSSGTEICRVHGDFGSENLFDDGRALWIVDWENSNASAPMLTDEVAYWLGANRELVRAKPSKAVHALQEDLNHDNSCNRIALALTFLSHAGFNLADSILSYNLA